jgi:hypothetical protein
MRHYGTIQIILHPNLSKDQRLTIVSQNVQNQLITTNRLHYFQILNQCIEISSYFREEPISVNFMMNEYEYSLAINTYL